MDVADLTMLTSVVAGVMGAFAYLKREEKDPRRYLIIAFAFMILTCNMVWFILVDWAVSESRAVYMGLFFLWLDLSFSGWNILEYKKYTGT